MSDLFTSDSFSPLIEIAPGVRTRVLTRGNLMFSLVEIDEGATSPIHHHPEVQMGLVLEGSFNRRQGGEEKLLQAGDGFYVPLTCLTAVRRSVAPAGSSTSSVRPENGM